MSHRVHRSAGEYWRENAKLRMECNGYHEMLTQVGLALGLSGKFSVGQIIERAKYFSNAAQIQVAESQIADVTKVD